MAPNVTINPVCETIASSNCNPVSVAAFLKKNNSNGIGLTYGGTACQVCTYEGRTRKSLHVVICNHGLRCCASVRQGPAIPSSFQKLVDRAEKNELDTWLCPNREAMCWQKLHSFYIPGGLFGKDPTSKWDENGCPRMVSVSTSSKMYRAKMAWMVKVGLAASNQKRGRKRKRHTGGSTVDDRDATAPVDAAAAVQPPNPATDTDQSTTAQPPLRKLL